MKKVSLILCLIILISGCQSDDKGKDTDDSDTVLITLQGDSIDTESKSVSIKGTTATIHAAGTYEVSGNLDDGQLIIDVNDNEKVNVILNSAYIHNENGAAIYVVNADETLISILEGTENTLSDGTEYSSNTADAEPNATLFSHDDLIINGSGKLTIKANYADAIASKDDLEIEDTTLVITAKDDGIRGKDSIVIKNADINVTAVSDAIKATNDTDETKGYIEIESSTFNLSTSGNTDSSSKGIKATTSVEIHSGTFNIDTTDDNIHAANVIINGGTYELSSDDDGIHADNKLEINDGELSITKSYEGIEAAELLIHGGKINIVASDDGINAAGGTDAESSNHPNDPFSSSSGTLTITDGTITVDAEGDGIDVNGDAVIQGGTIIVHGPVSGGNGALDYNGSFDITGGVLIAGGSSQMAESPSESSTQLSIMMYFDSIQSGGTKVRLLSSDGDEILSTTMKKQYQSVVFSSDVIKANTSYDIYVDESKYATIKTNGTITQSGYNRMQQEPGGGIPQR
ncbi:carbohydrate-binding domain-containing protein [Breznakia sp. OttesenSCG-928-G09]|nr:carbohydrate-binding domain-containing protein [Breznakia sp. OttesenSCG-928-G09]